MSLSSQTPLFNEISDSFFIFVERLYSALQKKKVKDVFFMAREGNFLKQLFDWYQEHVKKEHLVNTHYLLVSRRSTFLPSLYSLPKEDFSRFFKRFPNISLFDFLKSLNFSDQEITKITNCIAVNKHQRIRNFPKSQTFKLLSALPDFATVFEQKRIEQKQSFKKYLESFSVDYKNGLCLVDIGWSGSIQDNIFSILDGKINVQGYYLGLSKNTYTDSPHNEKHGLLFSPQIENRKFYPIYKHNRSLFEVISGTPHGMVLSYDNAQPVLDEGTEEVQLFHSKIEPIQKNILNAFKSFVPDSSEKLMLVAAKGHARMVFLPTQAEIKFFNSLYHFENFGLFQKVMFNKIFYRNTLAPICWRLLTLYNTHIPLLWRFYGWVHYLWYFGLS